MKSLNKVLALMVAMVMLFSIATSAIAYGATFTDVPETASYYTQLEVLSALKLMVGKSDTEKIFDPEGNVTRAEFATIVTRLANQFDLAKSLTKFPDVPFDHWASGYVGFATTYNGVIVGFEDGTFRPDLDVTYEQAVKMILCALGYEVAAKARGGYPVGYMTLATSGSSQIIPTSMKYTPSDPAKRKDIAVMLYNALEVPLMELISYSNSDRVWEVMDGSTSYRAKKNVLFSRLGYSKLKGTVSEASDQAGKARVTIDYSNKDVLDDDLLIGVNNSSGKFYVNNTNANNLKGYQTISYVINDDDMGGYKIVYCEKDSKRNETIKVDFDAVDSIEVLSNGNYKIKYKENGTTYNFDLNTGYDLYYNNELVSDALVYEGLGNILVSGKTESRTFKGSDGKDIIQYARGSRVSGYIEFVDKSGEGYSSVFVHEYKDTVIDTKSTSTYRITAKDGGYNMKALNPDDSNLKFTIRDKDGNKIEFADLKELDVLSIYYNTPKSQTSDDVKNMEVVVSRDVKEGKVTEIENSNKANLDKTVYIDGTAYKLSVSCNKIEIGDEGKFYLNVDGKIAFADTKSGASNDYAYISQVKDSDSGFSTGLLVEYLDKDGVLQVKNVASKVDIGTDADGKMVTGIELRQSMKNELKKIGVIIGDETIASPRVDKQLVCIQTNSSGYITKIVGAVKGPNNDQFSIDAPTNGLSATDLSYEYKSSTKKMDGDKKASFYVNDDTKVFLCEYGKKAEDYSVKSISFLKDGTKYDTIAYDLDDSRYAKAIVLYTAPSNIAEDSYMAVVSSVNEAKNGDNDTVYRIYYYLNGEKQNKLTTDGVYKDIPASKLAEGSVFKFATNDAGDIDSLRVIASWRGVDAKEALTNSKVLELDSKASVGKDNYIIGNIVKVSGRSVFVAVYGDANGKANSRQCMLKSNAVVYSYDSKAKDTLEATDYSIIDVLTNDDMNQIGPNGFPIDADAALNRYIGRQILVREYDGICEEALYVRNTK